MKAAAVCMFLMLALMPIFNVESAPPKKVDFSGVKKLPPDDTRVCIQIYDPVCGSDGKTYSNKCVFGYAAEQSDNKLTIVKSGEC